MSPYGVQVAASERRSDRDRPYAESSKNSPTIFAFFHKNYREIDANVGERVRYVSCNFIAFERMSMVLARATDVKQLSRPIMILLNAN